MVKSKFFFQLCSLATSQRRSLWPQSVEIIKLTNVIPWRHRQLASFFNFYHSERQQCHLIILLFCISLS